MPKVRGAGFYYVLMIIMFLSIIFFFAKNKYYKPIKVPTKQSFHTFYKQKISESKSLGVRPGDGEKLIHYGQVSNRAILYIHGFGATRAEGEFVVDSLSKLWKANTYYLRLPGHGLDDEEAHAKATFDQYLMEAEEALYRIHELGDSVIVVGTSMGGLLATYLAAQYPDMVQGLILFSPFYDYASTLGFAVKIPGFVDAYALINGNERKYEPSKAFEERVQPGYEDPWTMTQKVRAVKSLEHLRNYIAKKAVYEKVKSPVLMMFYYQDEEHQDKAASVSAMREAFDAFSSNIKMEYAISDGRHVLASKYMKTNKVSIFKKLAEWNAHF
jgi:pimeloyl-ACP methyl ester carboxylesterase